MPVEGLGGDQDAIHDDFDDDGDEAPERKKRTSMTQFQQRLMNIFGNVPMQTENVDVDVMDKEILAYYCHWALTILKNMFRMTPVHHDVCIKFMVIYQRLMRYVDYDTNICPRLTMVAVIMCLWNDRYGNRDELFVGARQNGVALGNMLSLTMTRMDERNAYIEWEIHEAISVSKGIPLRCLHVNPLSALREVIFRKCDSIYKSLISKTNIDILARHLIIYACAGSDILLRIPPELIALEAAIIACNMSNCEQLARGLAFTFHKRFATDAATKSRVELRSVIGRFDWTKIDNITGQEYPPLYINKEKPTMDTIDSTIKANSNSTICELARRLRCICLAVSILTDDIFAYGVIILRLYCMKHQVSQVNCEMIMAACLYITAFDELTNRYDLNLATTLQVSVHDDAIRSQILKKMGINHKDDENKTKLEKATKQVKDSIPQFATVESPYFLLQLLNKSSTINIRMMTQAKRNVTNVLLSSNLVLVFSAEQIALASLLLAAEQQGDRIKDPLLQKIQQHSNDANGQRVYIQMRGIIEKFKKAIKTTEDQCPHSNSKRTRVEK